MTSEQKTAIDACKDQAATEIQYESWDDMVKRTSKKMIASRAHRAMQLYGEQCRELVVKLTAEDIAYMIASYPSESDFLLAEKIYEKLTAPGALTG